MGRKIYVGEEVGGVELEGLGLAVEPRAEEGRGHARHRPLRRVCVRQRQDPDEEDPPVPAIERMWAFTVD